MAGGGCVPAERLRAMIRLLGPQEMTPTAKRQLEALCDDAEDHDAALLLYRQAEEHASNHSWRYPND